MRTRLWMPDCSRRLWAERKRSYPEPMRLFNALALGLASIVGLTSSLAHAQDRSSLVPTEKNYEKWVEFIRPSKKELAFEQIGWRNQFWPAVEEARRLGRPILLWTMNGHPLGCT